MCNFPSEKQTWKMGQNSKPNEMLVTRKLTKLKYHQVNKSKMKIHQKMLPGRKQGADFNIPQKRIQGLKHTG